MKKSDPLRDALLLRKRTLKRLRRRMNARRMRAKRVNATHARAGRAKISMKAAMLIIRAPEIIGLSRKVSHKAIVQFIEKLKAAVLHEGRDVCIDFRRTTKLYADGTLLMFAEIDSLVRRKKSKLTCTESNTQLVNEALMHLGVFKMLGTKCPIRPSHKEAVDWHVVRGQRTDLQAAGPVLERVAKSEEIAHELIIGLCEASNNISSHAYLGPREDGYGLDETHGWWWLFFRLSPEKNSLSVAICDLGVGIPRNMALHVENGTKGFPAALHRALQIGGLIKAHDGTLIHAAFESKKSSTGKKERGKGLGQIREVAGRTTGGGKLFVLSNAGGYQVFNDAADKEIEATMDYKESIFGTIICWQIPLVQED